MPIFVAPAAGLLVPRIGARPIVTLGMALLAVGLAWIAAVITATVDYVVLVPGFIVSGIGMGLFFAPIANVVLSAVGPTRRARRRAPTTRSARSAACSASRSSRRCSRRTARTCRPTPTWRAWCPPCGSAPSIVAVGAVVALAIPAGSAWSRADTAIDEIEDAVEGLFETPTPARPSGA